MIDVRSVTRETLSALLKLKVRDDQRDFVAPNSVTLAQVAYEQPGSHVWGLWDGDRAVGLIAMVDPGKYPWLEEGDDTQAAFIWRLMVDAEAQGKGVGSAAIEFALQQTRDWGLPRLSLTFVDEPNGPRRFYDRFGFAETGRIVDGEVELIRDV